MIYYIKAVGLGQTNYLLSLSFCPLHGMTLIWSPTMLLARPFNTASEAGDIVDALERLFPEAFEIFKISVVPVMN